jgi:hypothetical protein
MLRENLVDYSLMSQDAGWYHIGEPKGGTTGTTIVFLMISFLILSKKDLNKRYRQGICK